MNEREKQHFNPAALKRLLSYMKAYKGRLVLVTICILLSAVASAASSMFLKTLIDGYIAPLLKAENPVFTGLLRALAAGSTPEWIEVDTDELADRVTRRDSALTATADELAEAARRAAASWLD